MSDAHDNPWAFDFTMRQGPSGTYDQLSQQFIPPAQAWVAPIVLGAAMLAGAAFIAGIAVGYAAGAQAALTKMGARHG